jgi:large subunit ribosomal protein L15
VFTLDSIVSSGKKRKRVGRGGSRGGTSGAGHKGQKARSGGSTRIGFEGGQMPLFRRLPKRGFNNIQFKQKVKTVTLDQLNEFDEGQIVNKQLLIEKGIIKIKRGVVGDHVFALKVLGNGKLLKKLVVQVNAFSKSALKAIQDNGGTAEVIIEG